MIACFIMIFGSVVYLISTIFLIYNITPVVITAIIGGVTLISCLIIGTLYDFFRPG